ncbi:hypothetical protein EV148_1203 [Dokdonella fugitiva]|uniref:Uncharacterized protein n=2 Tax=Dokdonella fugitiva TaxID=328517 RepID=A0A4R2HSB8_9GAMM|nr:hypothetical protein EV148_1203 [Dokdonella fugitiva]
MHMKATFAMVFYDLTLDALISAGEVGVLARYRSQDLVVLTADLRDANLAVMLCVAPNALLFGQEYWLGQSYVNWHLAYGLSTKNFEIVSRSLAVDGLEWSQVPYAVLDFGTGEFTNAAAIRPDWNRNIFQTFVVPTSAVQAARAAIAASARLVGEFLYEPKAPHGGVETRYGECALEKLFDRIIYGYRRPAGLPPRVMGFGAEYIQSQTAQLSAVEADLAAGRLDQRTNWRRLTYRPLDAREFDDDQQPLVAGINLRKARLVEALDMPHFYYELFLRRIDTSTNREQSSYQLLGNDMDWTERLHAMSPGSFSPAFEERTVLERYIGWMQERYPFLARDPLDGFLRMPKMRKWKWPLIA